MDKSTITAGAYEELEKFFYKFLHEDILETKERVINVQAILKEWELDPRVDYGKENLFKKGLFR